MVTTIGSSAFAGGLPTYVHASDIGARVAVGDASKASEGQFSQAANGEKTSNLLEDIQTGVMENDFEQIRDTAEGYEYEGQQTD